MTRRRINAENLVAGHALYFPGPDLSKPLFSTRICRVMYHRFSITDVRTKKKQVLVRGILGKGTSAQLPAETLTFAVGEQIYVHGF